ncbi:MAG: ATP synthase F1 subunit epsilon [Puniceicoccales bacterium]|jgi:F-type H+-transporting ATPase subunit epsilon|nr:ATP synthase F1 subunit epsilon [Puniceicoccales bacterium]
MPLTLDIVTPAKKVFTGTADSVVLPTQSGLVDILPGHIPLTTLLVPGEVVVTSGGTVERLVVDKGFARVLGDTVSILTEAAIDTDDIDLDAVEKAEKRAAAALEAAKNGARLDAAEVDRMEQILRFSAAQKLIKRPR